MSNTDWYASACEAIERLKPWKAFNEYAHAVERTIKAAHGPRPEPKASSTELNLANLGSVAAEAQSLWLALPPSQRERPKRCARLPRAYPKLWMARAHSNSLMFEFNEMQSLPSNGLKRWSYNNESQT